MCCPFGHSIKYNIFWEDLENINHKLEARTNRTRTSSNPPPIQSPHSPARRDGSPTTRLAGSSTGRGRPALDCGRGRAARGAGRRPRPRSRRDEVGRGLEVFRRSCCRSELVVWPWAVAETDNRERDARARPPATAATATAHGPCHAMASAVVARCACDTESLLPI